MHTHHIQKEFKLNSEHTYIHTCTHTTYRKSLNSKVSTHTYTHTCTHTTYRKSLNSKVSTHTYIHAYINHIQKEFKLKGEHTYIHTRIHKPHTERV